MSLYDRLGGSEGIEKATAVFYGKVLADPQLAPHFTGTDMGSLARMQARFLAMAFGGPVPYPGRGLRQAHAALTLGDDDFDRVVGHLADTLRQLGVAEDDITAAGSIAETTRADVLGR